MAPADRYSQASEISDLSDHHHAVRLAELAGERLLEVRSRLQREGVEGLAVKDAGDAAAQEVLAAALSESFADDAVLSEEAADDPRRHQAQRVWIIDPLDGTREFSEFDRDDWAVHVALWSAGALVAGAVVLPARGITYSTADPKKDLPPLTDRPLRLAVSRSRPPGFVTQMAATMGAELVAMGSAGVKAMSVVSGQCDAYVHGGGQYEWDSAAPIAVASAAGLFTSRLDGSPLEYNGTTPWLPDLVVARPDIASGLLDQIAAVTE